MKKRSERKIFVFYDLRKAYDSVHRDILFKILIKKGQGNGKFLKIVQILWEIHKEGELIFD
jgi:hypothetical protein